MECPFSSVEQHNKNLTAYPYILKNIDRSVPQRRYLLKSCGPLIRAQRGNLRPIHLKHCPHLRDQNQKRKRNVHGRTPPRLVPTDPVSIGPCDPDANRQFAQCASKSSMEVHCIHMHQQESATGKNDSEASIRSVQIQGLHQRKRDANDDQCVDEGGTKTFPETGVDLISIYLKWQKVHGFFVPTFVQPTTVHTTATPRIHYH